jgi:hypothetical protein
LWHAEPGESKELALAIPGELFTTHLGFFHCKHCIMYTIVCGGHTNNTCHNLFTSTRNVSTAPSAIVWSVEHKGYTCDPFFGYFYFLKEIYVKYNFLQIFVTSAVHGAGAIYILKPKKVRNISAPFFSKLIFCCGKLFDFYFMLLKKLQVKGS